MKKQEILKIAKPILFNTETVRAIMKDKKTQERNPIDVPFRHEFIGWLTGSTGREDKKLIGSACFGYRDAFTDYETDCYAMPKCQVGDYLYVRETITIDEYENFVDYRADFTDKEAKSLGVKWTPSIHMPREAARIFLRVTDVRVERVQEISNEEAISEGLIYMFGNMGASITTPRLVFAEVWDSIYKSKGYGWKVNPWVFVYEFERVVVE